MKRLAVLLCSALLLLGAGSAWAKGDTLVVAQPNDAQTLDPHRSTESISCGAMRQVYEPLVTIDSKGDIVPLLAEKFDVSPDMRKFTFYLRKGVKFHNGETMTADDVIYSFQRVTGPGSALRSLAAFIDPKGLEKVDDHTVIVRTTAPAGASFLASMDHPWAAIVNKKAVESGGKDYGMNPVGTGKFKFASWVKGERIVYERFDAYWGQKAKLKSIIFRTVVEASSRTIELESGAVDVVQDLTPVDINRINDNKNLTAIIVPGQRVFFLAFDVTKKPYDDLRVRQAIYKVVNRQGIARAVFKGNAAPVANIIAPSILYSKKMPIPAIDVEGAKKLLTEAGHPNGFTMELITADRSENIGMATILQADLAKINIKVDIKVYEWGAFMDSVKQKGHNPYTHNWWGGAPALDPYFFMTPTFHSKSPASTNRFYYANPEMDEALDKGAGLMNGPERQAAYEKAQDIANRDLPWVSLAAPHMMRGAVKNLKGVEFGSGFMVFYGDAYFQ